MSPSTSAKCVAAIVVAAALSLASSAHAAEMKWETRLDRASAAAVQTNQPLLLDFWSASCVPCVEMDKDVYADERVLTAMAKVRAVRVDIDRDPAVARKYSISGTPTLLVTDSFGREIFRYLGALPTNRMVQLLDALPADISSINRFSAALAAKKDDFDALAGMARELRAVGFYRSSSEYYERALRTREGSRSSDARVELLVGRERNAGDLRLYVDVIRLCEEALRELGGRPEEPDVQLDLARGLLATGKTADGERVLRAVIARHPSTSAAAEAARLLASR